MADTKQATPLCPMCGHGNKEGDYLPHVYCGFHVARGRIPCGCRNDWHRLASRSGPDRTPDTVEYWKSRATTAELKVLTFHEEIAKLRSGPDRTTQEHARELAEQFLAVVDSDDYPLDEEAWLGLTKILEAGPDRGQQDAPLCSQSERDAALLRNLEPEIIYYGPYQCECGATICKVSADQGGMAFAYPQGIIYPNTNWVQHVCAKAAREGQAPKGDRIKVEREPGCKCEYAIWTNAKGCPLHDVPDPVQAQKE